MRKLITLICLGALWTIPVRAIQLDLVTNNVTMPSGRTFQMPLNGSDAGGGPLKYSVSIKNKSVTGTIAPATNRSVDFNVSGVDATNGPFTGDLILQLYEDLTTNTTAHIINLVNSNVYNGLTIYRVVPNFVCQGGATTNFGATFDDEFVDTLTYTGFGQLGMANSGHDSNGSEFFITDVDLSEGDPSKLPPRSIDFMNPIFGQLTRGFDVVSKIMSTPLSGEAPLTPIVINTATIITNSQDGVLRLAAKSGFIGTVPVTITVANSSRQTAQETLTVNVVSNTVNDPPFFGPIPDSIDITQGQAAAFRLTGIDVDHDPLTLDPSGIPANVTPGFENSGLACFVPDLTFTGTVQVTLGVTDNQPGHQEDTQTFTINVAPRSPTPTMNLVLKSGTITTSTTTNNGSIKIAGTFTFTGGSDNTIIGQDIVVLALGDQSNPYVLTNAPFLTDYTYKKGVITLKTPKGNVPTISAQFSQKGTFKIAISNIDMTGTNNPFEVSLQIGDNYGADVRTWVQKKPGVFTLK
jgi:cyclophilin family peptidyl-prolyl cis-trans isomerase